MERMEESKKKMKKNHDAGTWPRVFALGSMVLIKTPYMRGKQGDVWEGQSAVIRVISVVTIEIPVPNRQTKRQVNAHYIYIYISPEAAVLRVEAALVKKEEQGTTLTKDWK